ncbi:MAG TPA: hypothetical protein ACFYD7_00800 [Candidatus Wujingus californicus]|uniref:hypothetical protein n=1 Tax=Candidatus Wujingus californicus TaxID=3367618 RepID=UPI001DE23AC5|nr:hypothetical protein [Planctomycetota bacterium]MDO8130304.1 hypothetical protein [Candidatus Brocadiales bacterium]
MGYDKLFEKTDMGQKKDSVILDAVGLEIYTFEELVREILGTPYLCSQQQG